ncbi:hypothetical protein FOZ60_014525 [Perkinsus olseni]|uniref:Uncharacterized protein n=1 Tax=Perkinsus olseni TaxID=32597 RepID=A0A7J6P703_PEROL|nr:hypothetical protein FOZ60_014525 [Perkinsus olseni]
MATALNQSLQDVEEAQAAAYENEVVAVDDDAPVDGIAGALREAYVRSYYQLYDLEAARDCENAFLKGEGATLRATGDVGTVATSGSDQELRAGEITSSSLVTLALPQKKREAVDTMSRDGGSVVGAQPQREPIEARAVWAGAKNK